MTRKNTFSLVSEAVCHSWGLKPYTWFQVEKKRAKRFVCVCACVCVCVRVCVRGHYIHFFGSLIFILKKKFGRAAIETLHHFRVTGMNITNMVYKLEKNHYINNENKNKEHRLVEDPVHSEVKLKGKQFHIQKVLSHEWNLNRDFKIFVPQRHPIFQTTFKSTPMEKCPPKTVTVQTASKSLSADRVGSVFMEL